jgi:hypothetical protein
MSSKWAETSGEWVHRPCKEAEADGYIVWEREAANGTIYKVTLEPTRLQQELGVFISSQQRSCLPRWRYAVTE